MTKESTKAAFQKVFSTHALLHLTYEECVELGAPEAKEGEPRYCSFGPGCRCEKIPDGKPKGTHVVAPRRNTILNGILGAGLRKRVMDALMGKAGE